MTRNVRHPSTQHDTLDILASRNSIPGMGSLHSLSGPGQPLFHADSNTSLTVRPAPSDFNTKTKFDQSPSHANLGFRGIIKD